MLKIQFTFHNEAGCNGIWMIRACILILGLKRSPVPTDGWHAAVIMLFSMFRANQTPTERLHVVGIEV